MGDSREPNTPHANARSIMGTDGNRVVGDQFGEFGRAGGQVIGQPFKIIQLVPHSRSDTDTIFVSVAEAFLEKAEQAAAAGDANGHASEFPQHLMPGGRGDFVFAFEGGKDVL